MTRKTNARMAGIAFLAYIVLGISSMVVTSGVTSGQGIAARLASMAENATEVRVAVVLVLFSSFMALVLGVFLYAITRDVDPDLAMLALTFRVGEGVVGALAIQRTLGLLWLATATGANAPDPEAARAIGSFITGAHGGTAGFFAVGSLLFCWLLLRGRLIPVSLAWLGFLASVLWVVALPLQVTGVLRLSVVQLFLWVPMAAFEIPCALWLIIKGVATPAARPSTTVPAPAVVGAT